MTTEEQIALASVIVSAATPVALVAVGYFLDHRIKSVERTVERETKLSEARFDLYKEIAFQLNDIFSYFNFVGLWKELTCENVIERKRALDRHIYAYRPVLSSQFFERYLKFTEEAFVTNTGWRKDAKLRTFTTHRDEHGDEEKMACFTQEDNRANIRHAYDELLQCLAADLSLASDVERQG